MRRLLLALSLLLLWGINCTKPTGPVTSCGPIVYAITDQSAYDNYSRIFYIDTSTDSLVDSLLIPYQCYGLGVSDDGSTLYIGLSGLPFNGMEIDTKTKRIKYFGPNTGVPIPKERLLVNPVSSDFFDAVFHQLVYKADSLTPDISPPISGRRFDTKGKLFYGPLRNSWHKIGVFDYSRFRLVKVIDVEKLGARKLPTGNSVVTFDGGKYYYSVPLFAPYEYFVGIDLRNNRLVAEYIVIGGGFLGITPLNDNIYMTDPGGYFLPPSPNGLVQIYSPVSERFLTPIDVTKEPNPCDSLVLLALTDMIAISPDGRKAYISTWIQATMIVIDILTNRVKKVSCGFPAINSLVVQKN